MKRHQGWAGVALLCCAGVQAEVRVEVPRDFQILAVSAGKVQDEQHAVLADGVQQLLVRYEGVIPSRNSSDNDRQIRSEPQVLRPWAWWPVGSPLACSRMCWWCRGCR